MRFPKLKYHRTYWMLRNSGWSNFEASSAIFDAHRGIADAIKRIRGAFSNRSLIELPLKHRYDRN